MYSRKHFLLYYYKYKDSVYFSLGIFFILLLVAFILLWKVVLPQMYSWFSINSEVVATRKKIESINANITYINSLDDSDLTQKRTIFVRALPYEKDIQGILTTISSSAINSSTKLDDYSLTIGELSPKNPKANLASLSLTLNVVGTPATFRQFVANLHKRLPLVDVSGIDLTSTSGVIELVVYYKPLPVFKVNDADPIQRISGKFDDIYATLSQWSSNADSPIDTTSLLSPPSLTP